MGSKSRNSSSHGDGGVLKPLVKGCATGQLHALFVYCNRSMYEELARSADPNFMKTKLPPLPLKHIPILTHLKMNLVYGSICTTATLGIFEILSKRLRDGNEGMPLTLSQEACCGFIAGSVATFAWHPFDVARHRVGLQNCSYTNWFSHISLNRSMWRCASIPQRIAIYTGMLASHDRALNYLTAHNQTLPFWTAQIGAGIISGFFATACSQCVAALQESKRMQMRHVISRLLRDSNLQTNILKRFRFIASFCVVQYAIYECVRRVE